MPSSSSESNSASAPIDLKRVRRLFSDPQRIAESAFIRREIAARMHERLQLIKVEPALVLDAGCGDGADLPTLQQAFPQARLCGLDAAQPLLQVARSHHRAASHSINSLLRKWLPASLAGGDGTPMLACGDFAQLPLAGQSIDIIWSNLALHWHPQPDRVFAEWRRVLKVDGLLMFSCFGPDTFRELRQAFGEAGAAAGRLLPFVDMHDFGDMLVEAGFSTPVMDMEKITVTYETISKLIGDLRAIGGNPLSNRPAGLLSRATWDGISQALERQRRDGKIPLTFEVIYGHAFKPAPRTTQSGEAIIRFQPPRK